ncbi:MAG: hypothetical protein AAF682_09230 [Planctomycetota bacterium]
MKKSWIRYASWAVVLGACGWGVLQAAAATGGPASVALTLVRPDGGPAAGLEVALGDAVARTDRDGRARLEAPSGEALVLRVDARGWAGEERPIAPLLKGERRGLGELVLRPAVALRGRVDDEQGRPVANARVIATPHRTPLDRFAPGGALTRPQRVERLARTADDGTFRIDGLDLDLHSVALEHPSLERRVLAEPCADPWRGEPIELVLAHGKSVDSTAPPEASPPPAPRPRQDTGAIGLRVVDLEGSPVPFGHVRLVHRDGAPVEREGGAVDAWGYAAWPALPAGAYFATYVADHGLPEALGPRSAPRPHRIKLSVRAGRDTFEELVLLDAPVVRVRVLREGEPVPGVAVGAAPVGLEGELLWRLLDPSGQARTDGRGEAVLALRYGGPATVFARSRQDAAAATTTVRVGPGVHAVEVTLGAAEVAGIVASPGGEPLAGSVARLLPERRPPAVVSGRREDGSLRELELGEVAVRCDGRGRFRFREVPAGRYRIELHRDGHFPHRSVCEVRAGAAAIDLGVLGLTPRCVVDGSVLLNACGRRHVVVELRDAAGETVHVGAIGGDGSFRLDDVAPGTFTLRVPCPSDTHVDGPFTVSAATPNTRRVEIGAAR